MYVSMQREVITFNRSQYDHLLPKIGFVSIFFALCYWARCIVDIINMATEYSINLHNPYYIPYFLYYFTLELLPVVAMVYVAYALALNKVL